MTTEFEIDGPEWKTAAELEEVLCGDDVDTTDDIVHSALNDFAPEMNLPRWARHALRVTYESIEVIGTEE